MLRRTWQTEHEGRPLELRAAVDVDADDVTVWVDGFPAHRERLPARFRGDHTVHVDVDGAPLILRLIPQGATLRMQAVLAGRDLDTGQTVQMAAQRLPWQPVQGRLHFSPQRYYSCYPKMPNRALTAVLAGVTMLGWAWWWSGDAWTEATQTLGLFGCGALITGAVWLFQHVRHMRRLFAWGEVVPARVVALNPTRLAVHADLGFDGRGHAWVVKVTEQPLEQVGQPAIGDRTTVFIQFHDSQDGKRHHDVTVTTVACGCDDEEAVRALQTGIPDEAWKALDEGWQQAGAPVEVGMHWLQEVS